MPLVLCPANRKDVIAVPSEDPNTAPGFQSHNLTVASREPERANRSSGLKATA